MYSSTSARSALISIRLAPSRTMASRSESRSDRSSSPTTMLNMGVPSMDGLSAVLGLQQTGGYATLLSPNSIHNFGLYPRGSQGCLQRLMPQMSLHLPFPKGPGHGIQGGSSGEDVVIDERLSPLIRVRRLGGCSLKWLSRVGSL